MGQNRGDLNLMRPFPEKEVVEGVEERRKQTTLFRLEHFRLPFYVMGIYFFYLYYAVIQEKISAQRHGGEDGERFTFFILLVFAQCFGGSTSAWLALRCRVPSLPKLEMARIGFTYVGAMWASNTALKFVNYPTQVLAKSCKMIPVMIMGLFVFRKKYTMRQFVCVAMITGGISLFMLMKNGPSHPADENPHSLLGLALIFTSLAFDGLTGAQEDHLIERHHPSSHQLMFWVNVFGLMWTGLGLGITGQGVEGVAFLHRHPSVLFDITVYAFFSALGQFFVFAILRHYGALACTIITTTRKFFTILASVFWFRHHLVAWQWVGVLLVFGGLAWDLYAKSRQRTPQKKE